MINKLNKVSADQLHQGSRMNDDSQDSMGFVATIVSTIGNYYG